MKVPKINIDYKNVFQMDKLQSSSKVFDEKPPEYKPIEFSWAWLAKYFDKTKREWDAVYYSNPTHAGIYSPTGAGKTFLRNAIVEVSLWAHDTVIILSDRKLDSIGFLLPQDPLLMTNQQYFTNPRTGNFPIRPEPLPKQNFHLWLPATNFSFYDNLIEELMKWGVVNFYRFHPSCFLETTAGDFLPKAVGMSMMESQATSQAISKARGSVTDKNNWSFSDLKGLIEEQEQITGRSKPYEKLMLLDINGIVSKEKTVTLINKNTGEQREEDVVHIRNTKNIISDASNLHVFCNKYMSSAVADNTLSMAINYILFSMFKEDCEMVTRKRRVFCHLPEAQYSFTRTSAETQENKIKGYFSDSYVDGMRETRQWNLFNILDTQQVTRIPDDITANQLTLWLMPGFQHKGELAWLEKGVGRAHLNDSSYNDLFSMRNPFNNRGKAFYIGPDKAVLCYTRPRQTYHFQEGNNPLQLLKRYRLEYDNAETWKRWDE